MSKEKEKPIDRFKVASDTGQTFTIIRYQTYIITGEFGENDQAVPTTQRLATSNGDHVNEIDENTFEVLTGINPIAVKKM